LEWEQVVPSLLGTILGNTNYIDSVLVSTNREDGTLEEPSLRVILNKLICLVVIAKYGILWERDDAAYMLNQTYIKLRILYMRVLGMNISPGDQQTYVALHDRNLRRSIAQETFVKEEDARKQTVYCGDDGRLYGVVFDVAVGQNYRQSIRIEDLIAPPTGILPTLQVMHAPDGFAQRSQQQLWVNHVDPYVAVPSVHIYHDGTMVENPQGYPVNPRIAQQLANPSDMLMDEEDVRIVDLLDDEDDNPHLTVIDYHTIARPGVFVILLRKGQHWTGMSNLEQFGTNITIALLRLLQ
jgi:hypothetical protein